MISDIDTTISAFETINFVAKNSVHWRRCGWERRLWNNAKIGSHVSGVETLDCRFWQLLYQLSVVKERIWWVPVVISAVWSKVVQHHCLQLSSFLITLHRKLSEWQVRGEEWNLKESARVSQAKAEAERLSLKTAVLDYYISPALATLFTKRELVTFGH